MTAILGISAYYHDAAAALVVDGRIVAAAQEERFTRRKHDPEFPANAVEYCLREAGLEPSRLDLVVFYEKPYLKFDRLLETYLATAPVGLRSFVKALPVWLRKKLHLDRELRAGLPGYRRAFAFCEHHESHAASAFFPSPFREAAIVTMDGVGEWATSSVGAGRENRIELLFEQRFPHSLGLLYSAFTYFTGFKVNSGEYKLMGLAPYGEPRYAQLIRDHLIDLKDDGSFRMNLDYFEYCAGLSMTSPRFAELFGGPPREPEAPLTAREWDLAASIQQVTEEIVLRVGRFAHAQTGLRELCLAGGVALNCVANGRLVREGPFERIWVQPAAGDAGGALGAALLGWHQLYGEARSPVEGSDAQAGSLLGPRFSDDEVRKFLDGVGARYRRFDDDDSLVDAVAGLLADEKVVGWLQGRMEFGPRALGARSIIGDARSPRMQSTMNLKIKFRESFRPFAPSVLQDRAAAWFDVRDRDESPYMLLVAPVRAERRTAPAPEDGSRTGIDKLRTIRSEIPAVTHVDYSARLQTVDEVRHGRYHALLRRFEERTGCPVIINTSFNVRGEPIVCTPGDAWRCFMSTEIDALVLERNLVLKQDQENRPGAVERERHLAAFELD